MGLSKTWVPSVDFKKWVMAVAVEGLTIKLLRPAVDLESHSDEVWHILESVDKDFFPSLSARTQSNKHDLTQKVLWGGPISFFETVMRENVLMAYVDDRAVAMMSFIAHYREPMLEPWTPCTYASTMAVLARYRRRGIARALNDALELLPDDLASPFIARRTWSTNQANLTLLKRGFEEILRLPNHRGPGVDTIYLARRTKLDETP